MQPREPIPEKTRNAVKVRSKGRCEDCGDVAIDMHHLRYTIPDLYLIELSIFGRETPDDLVHLCRTCHDARHRDMNGEFWRDPEEMERHWEPYYAAMEKND